MDAEIHERRPPERPRLRGELPILFHLRDVSRPRPGAAKPQGTGTAPLEPSAGLSAVAALASVNAPALENPLLTANAVEPKSTDFPVTEEVADDPIGSSNLKQSFIPLAALPPVVPIESADEVLTESSVSAVECTAPEAEAIVPLSFARATPLAMASSVPDQDVATSPSADVTDVAPAPASSDTVVQARPERRFRTPATEKWFTTHGRFIAACFVVALAGTVYLARNNRKQTSPDAGSPAGPLLAATETATSPTISLPSQDANVTHASGAVSQFAKPETSTVELFVPVAAGPDRNVASAEKSNAQDNLFQIPASKKSEERVAARADLNSAAAPFAAASNAATAASPVATAMPTAYPVTNAQTSHQEPVAHVSYPQTAYPQTAYPQAGYQQASYPQTSYPQANSPASAAMSPASTHGHVSPAAAYQPAGQPFYPPNNHYPQAAAWGPPAPPVPTAPGQSSEITARGQRYERIGSGNY